MQLFEYHVGFLSIYLWAVFVLILHHVGSSTETPFSVLAWTWTCAGSCGSRPPGPTLRAPATCCHTSTPSTSA
eukprot:3638934-Pyramimonas_sp.AAC.1